MCEIKNFLSRTHPSPKNKKENAPPTHTQKEKKNPKENVLPEKAQTKFQQIEIARAHSASCIS